MKKIFILFLIIVSCLFTTNAITIQTSPSLLNMYIEKHIPDKKVSNEVESLIRYNYYNFIDWFIAKYDKQSSLYFSPISISEAVMPSVFYKSYDLFKKDNDIENPYNTNKSYLSREKKRLIELKEWSYKKFLPNINKNVISRIKNWQLYEPIWPASSAWTVDPVSVLKYDINYQSTINDNDIHYISTPVSKKWDDFLKNIFWIKNNKCKNYKNCAKKAFIGNNWDNIPSNKMKKINISNIFNNNIRSLTLWQSNNFIWDFILTDFMSVVNNKNNGALNNVVDLYNKKSISLNQNESENSANIFLKNKLNNLKLYYNSVTNIIDRYYVSPRRVLQTLLGCTIEQDRLLDRCIDINSKNWGKTETLIVKKGKTKTTLLAFVSALDLPSTYLWKTDTSYYPTKYEASTYKDWIKDNIYTNNWLFSEDFAKLTNTVSAKNFRNWFSWIQWKYLLNSKSLYHTKRNKNDITEYSTMVTENSTPRYLAWWMEKWFSINFFPTLTFNSFKIELNNSSKTIQLIENHNSLYNKLLSELKTIYHSSYVLWWGYTLWKEYITNDNTNSIVWVISNWDIMSEKNVNKNLFPWTTNWSMDSNHVVTKKITKNKYVESENSYKTIVSLHTELQSLIITLDKKTSSLYNKFISNPTTANYDNYIDNYATQLVYSSLYNVVKKIYYPFVYTHNHGIMGWFNGINWLSSTHVNFTSVIDYQPDDLNDPFIKDLVNKYANVVKTIENYHYTKKEQQMINDWIANKTITSLIGSFVAIPSNQAESKLQKIMENALTLSNVNPYIRKNQYKYNSVIHSIYNSIDYNKFSQFINSSDQKYNQSTALIRLSNSFKKEGLSWFKTYYTLNSIYSVNPNLKNIYDITNDYILGE